MKYYLSIIFSLILNFSFCQNIKKSNIYILGTVHESSKILTPERLLKILEDIKPDILLQETDNEGIITYFDNIKPSSNERNASLNYIKKNPLTLNLPYEFDGRNSYRKINGMTPTDDLTINLIDSLYHNNLLSESNSVIYKKYNEANKELIKYFQSNIEDLNSINFEVFNRYRQDLQHHELKKITNSEKIFSERFVIKPNGDKISYKDGFLLWCNFWDLRNNTMALNIIKTVNLHKEKTIVVLTGAQHKYYLKELLEKYNDGNYELIEYFDKI